LIGEKKKGKVLLHLAVGKKKDAEKRKRVCLTGCFGKS